MQSGIILGISGLGCAGVGEEEGGTQGIGVLENLDHSAFLGVKERNEGGEKEKRKSHQ